MYIRVCINVDSQQLYTYHLSFDRNFTGWRGKVTSRVTWCDEEAKRGAVLDITVAKHILEPFKSILCFFCNVYEYIQSKRLDFLLVYAPGDLVTIITRRQESINAVKKTKSLLIEHLE